MPFNNKLLNYILYIFCTLQIAYLYEKTAVKCNSDHALMHSVLQIISNSYD